MVEVRSSRFCFGSRSSGGVDDWVEILAFLHIRPSGRPSPRIQRQLKTWCKAPPTRFSPCALDPLPCPTLPLTDCGCFSQFATHSLTSLARPLANQPSSANSSSAPVSPLLHTIPPSSDSSISKAVFFPVRSTRSSHLPVHGILSLQHSVPSFKSRPRLVDTRRSQSARHKYCPRSATLYFLSDSTDSPSPQHPEVPGAGS